MRIFHQKEIIFLFRNKNTTKDCGKLLTEEKKESALTAKQSMENEKGKREELNKVL